MESFHKHGTAILGTVFLAAGLTCITASCGTKRGRASTAPEEYTVARVDLRDAITQVGEVHPIVKVDLKSEASGRIDTVAVKEGQPVGKGQVICIIDPENLLIRKEKVDLAVRKAEIELKLARRDYENARSLRGVGSVSQNRLGNLKSQLELKQIALEQQKLEQRNIHEQLSKTEVRAPMSGVLIRLNVEQGEIATSATSGLNAGTKIGTIADISRLEVISEVGEVDYVHLDTGQSVVITPEAVENVQTSGTITFISLSAKKGSNDELASFPVRISVDSIIQGLAPGINVNVEFLIMEKKNVLGIPCHFVKKEKGTARVSVREKTPDGTTRVSRRTITLGKTDFRHYEVVSGLQEGDVVVLSETAPRRKRPPRNGKK